MRHDFLQRGSFIRFFLRYFFKEVLEFIAARNAFKNVPKMFFVLIAQPFEEWVFGMRLSERWTAHDHQKQSSCWWEEICLHCIVRISLIRRSLWLLLLIKFFLLFLFLFSFLGRAWVHLITIKFWSIVFLGSHKARTFEERVELAFVIFNIMRLVGKPKIADYQATLWIYKQILRLNVSVNYAM